ncbi:hypothetical protein L596_028125 [Steinernema carpocapsae]|uniref:Uncharacterized protein n=1 Tax=Steinernema carpocapsae TaxID=34508 RepID=A0A4U5LXH7_STECR|nr:hypothetical protein L596_028125 [Steinernema carpocapsae]
MDEKEGKEETQINWKAGERFVGKLSWNTGQIWLDEYDEEDDVDDKNEYEIVKRGTFQLQTFSVSVWLRSRAGGALHSKLESRPKAAGSHGDSGPMLFVAVAGFALLWMAAFVPSSAGCAKKKKPKPIESLEDAKSKPPTLLKPAAASEVSKPAAKSAYPPKEVEKKPAEKSDEKKDEKKEERKEEKKEEKKEEDKKDGEKKEGTKMDAKTNPADSKESKEEKKDNSKGEAKPSGTQPTGTKSSNKEKEKEKTKSDKDKEKSKKSEKKEKSDKDKKTKSEKEKSKKSEKKEECDDEYQQVNFGPAESPPPPPEPKK